MIRSTGAIRNVSERQIRRRWDRIDTVAIDYFEFSDEESDDHPR
jgi:hypothetical protein